MIVLMGSQALAHHMPLGRKPSDTDFVATYDDAMAFFKAQPGITSMYPVDGGNKLIAKSPAMIYECEIAWSGSLQASFIDMVKADPSTRFEKRPNGFVIPSLNTLYMLKMSHRYLRNSPHFLKTMRDIHAMRAAGAVIQPEHAEWYDARVKETYAYAHPKLNVKKNDFFNGDGVNYVYDHDTIHEAVKMLDKPAYTFFKPENSPVMCDKNMFFGESKTVQWYAGLEEAYVLAIERSLVPFPGVKTPREAFMMALSKVCTSITSGWFREFCWENYDQIVALYNDDYWIKFQCGVDSGIVKPYNPETAY